MTTEGTGRTSRLVGLMATGVLALTSALEPAALTGAPETPARLIFTSAPGTVTVGQIATFTVQRQDSSGNPVTAGSLFVSIESVNGEQFVEPATGSALPEWDKDDHRFVITIPAGSSTASVGYKPILAAPFPFPDTSIARAVYNGVTLTPAEAKVGVKAGAATKLAFDHLVGSPAAPRGPGWVKKFTNPTAGDDPTAVGTVSLKSLVIEMQDDFDNKNPHASPSITVSTSSSTGAFALDSSGCATEKDFTTNNAAFAADRSNVRRTLTASASSGELKVCYLDETAGVANITTAASGLTEGKTWVNVTTNELKIKELTGPASLMEGSLSPPYTLSFDDADGDGNVDSPDVDIVIGLIGTEGLKRVLTARFHRTDGTRLRAVGKYGQLAVKKGFVSAQFAVRDTDPDPDTHVVHAVLGGKYPTVREGKVDIKVLPVAADHFTMTTVPQTMTAGTTSAEITAELRDSDGNPFASTSDLIVELTSSSRAGEFLHSLSTTELDPAVLVLPAASSALSFIYRDKAAGTPAVMLTTTIAGKSVKGTQPALIIGGAPARLGITTLARTADVAQSTDTITVQLQDADGVATPAESNLIVALSPTSSEAAFRDGDDKANITFVTIAVGESEASFRYRDNVAGTPTITVQASSLTSASQKATIGAAAPVPVLPTSAVPPPDTPPPPAFLADVPLINVSFAHFGPSNPVQMLTIPVLRATPFQTRCWSGPNATPEEAVGALLHGTKPAGTQFIYFFIRGTRSYVFDPSFGNYCWVDLTLADGSRIEEGDPYPVGVW